MRHVSHKHGAELVNSARVAMLTRERDLEQIAYASADDAWILEDEDGLCFVALGKVPERRFVLEATYVYLVVKNGVPVGYLQGSGLGGWAEINYNIFPPWRGRDAAALYARSLAVIRAFQHVSTFIVDPYQLGADNEEAIASGAWWFYYKLGFRPRGREARALALREQDRVTKRVSYRSSPSTLRELALSPMVLQLYDQPRFPYGGVGPVGLHASHRLSKRGGGLRSEGLASASEEAAALLGASATRARACAATSATRSPSGAPSWSRSPASRTGAPPSAAACSMSSKRVVAEPSAPTWRLCSTPPGSSTRWRRWRKASARSRDSHYCAREAPAGAFFAPAVGALPVVIGPKRTCRFALHMSAFDPKRTLAAVSPRSNRTPFVLAQTIAWGAPLLEISTTRSHHERRPWELQPKHAVFTSPFLSLLHDRRGFRRHRRLAHTAPSLRRSAWARHSYQR